MTSTNPAPAAAQPKAARRELPIFSSLTDYRLAWLAADFVAGITLVAIAIPEQMATAQLAGMPVQTGLYAFIAGGLATPRSPRSSRPASPASRPSGRRSMPASPCSSP